MSDQPTTREELYERIKNSSKLNVILEEMIRLGFWPADKPVPKDPDEEIKQRQDLEAESRALGSELARLSNFNAMRKEMRKRRMEESRKKQAAHKEARIKKKVEKAAFWKKRQQTEIVYLGSRVSAGLRNQENNREKLAQYGLPLFENPLKLAEAMGITLGQLRFLAYDKAVSRISHYIRFCIPKRNGKLRTISAPMPHLKQAQHWILQEILYKVKAKEEAHGFIPGRSIVTNALPHVKSRILINVDLKDFFPSINLRRVKGLFCALGFSEAIALILALLCTEPDTQQVEMDGLRYHVRTGERALPQGAPTSPHITNLICRRMDKRLAGLAAASGCTYTRYADDLTFSAAADVNIGRLLCKINYIVESENFHVNPEKTKIIRQHKRQEVTGIVVNEKVNISRRKLKRFRALLFQIAKDGLKGKHWGRAHNVVAAIRGFAHYVAMVNPAKGECFLEQVQKLFGGKG